MIDKGCLAQSCTQYGTRLRQVIYFPNGTHILPRSSSLPGLISSGHALESLLAPTQGTIIFPTTLFVVMIIDLLEDSLVAERSRVLLSKYDVYNEQLLAYWTVASIAISQTNCALKIINSQMKLQVS